MAWNKEILSTGYLNPNQTFFLLLSLVAQVFIYLLFLLILTVCNFWNVDQWAGTPSFSVHEEGMTTGRRIPVSIKPLEKLLAELTNDRGSSEQLAFPVGARWIVFLLYESVFTGEWNTWWFLACFIHIITLFSSSSGFWMLVFVFSS